MIFVKQAFMVQWSLTRTSKIFINAIAMPYVKRLTILAQGHSPFHLSASKAAFVKTCHQ